MKNPICVFSGSPLKTGTKVVYTQHHYSGLNRGYISRPTPKGAKIVDTKEDIGNKDKEVFREFYAFAAFNWVGDR